MRMKECNLFIDLNFFGDSEKDFFTNAFNEAYNISKEDDIPETPSEPVEAPESVSEPEVDTKVDEVIETPVEPITNPLEFSPEDIKKMYEEHYGAVPEVNEDTNDALELYNFLKENPHLVDAMRMVDQSGYNDLQRYVPDDVHQKLKELEDYVQEQKYQTYINELKGKYKDFDEDKVLKYAEDHDVYDLDVAYKAMKQESSNQEESMKKLREEIKAELLKEMKENSQSTNSIIGGADQSIVTDSDVKLTSNELKMAKAFGLSPKEYAQWK